MDESGFSLSPSCAKTWAPLGQPPTLLETFSRQTQTVLGLFTVSPKLRQLNFYSTIFDGPATSDDFIFWLRQFRYFNQSRSAIILWDGLSAHRKAENYFMDHHPDWFTFEYFPAYSPELNPVEPCWNWMKNVDMANFIPHDIPHLHSRALQSSRLLKETPTLLKSFLHYSGLKL